jgi:hypothetical protein
MDFLQTASAEKKEGEEKEKTLHPKEEEKDDKVDRALFTRNDQPVITKTTSTRKNMKREYIPKTILQFLRERKSYEENNEFMQKHMTHLSKITSPLMASRPPLINVPEFYLDGSGDTPKGEITTFVIAVLFESNYR